VRVQSSWNRFSKEKLLANIKNFAKKKFEEIEEPNFAKVITFINSRTKTVEKRSQLLNTKKSRYELVFV